MTPPARGDGARGLVRVGRSPYGKPGFCVRAKAPFGERGGLHWSAALHWDTRAIAESVAEDIRKCIRYAVKRALTRPKRGGRRR